MRQRHYECLSVEPASIHYLLITGKRDTSHSFEMYLLLFLYVVGNFSLTLRLETFDIGCPTSKRAVTPSAFEAPI